MQILFQVECREGEESNWLSEVSAEELDLLYPLLYAIKANFGYFPTGTYKIPGDPSVEDIYGSLPGFGIINRFLPTPEHGFCRIRTIYLFENDPKILDLV